MASANVRLVCRVLPVLALLAILFTVPPKFGPLVSGDKLRAGEAIYAQRCASCHGRDLNGGNAQSMVDGVWQFGSEERAIIRNIKFGISSVGMPAYQAALDDQQIRWVVEFITNTQERLGVKRPPIPEQLETRDYDVRVQQWIARGIEIPWALTFIDGDSALLTERPGRLRLIENGQLDSRPVSGTPPVLHTGQGGLMDVAVDPDYDRNRWIYLSYSHAIDRRDSDGNQAAMTRVVRGRIADGAWVDQQILFEAPPDHYSHKRQHHGSRLAFDREGFLYFSIGDRGTREHAQELSRPNGKIHRICSDGAIPSDNPFRDTPTAMPSVYNYGHRNPQGLAVEPKTGRVWSSEHGPMGGDELNLIAPGLNYGWPSVSYGIGYDGQPITDQVAAPGMEQPVFYWVPSIAVCGIDFYVGTEFPRWQGNLFVGGLGYEEVRRLVIQQDRVIHQELILKNSGRVRDICCGPDGAIYVVLNGPDKILRLSRIATALRQ